jgi:hypothetical protein
MIFSGNEPPELRIEQFWEVDTPDWTEFYVICSGRIFSLNENEKLKEISSLPSKAREIPFVQHQSSFSQPTPLFRDRVALVGGWFGGDVKLVLANGAVVNRFLNWWPEFKVTSPALEFYEPPDVIRLEIVHTPEELTPFPIELLST